MGRWAVQVFRMPHPAHQQPAPGADRVCVVAVADSGVVYAANNLLHGHTLGYVDRLPLAADETVSLLALLVRRPHTPAALPPTHTRPLPCSPAQEVSGRRRAARLAAATTDGRVVDLDVADADANGTAFALRKRLLNRPAGYLAGIGRLLSWGAAASAATHSVGALFPIPAQCDSLPAPTRTHPQCPHSHTLLLVSQRRGVAVCGGLWDGAGCGVGPHA